MRFVSAVHDNGRRLNQNPFRPRAGHLTRARHAISSVNTTEKWPLLAGNRTSELPITGWDALPMIYT